ncbi:hypothetical protein [Microtetraspora malaysiensis]|uniref:Uncharacterized protein n=1 Tax=Microtetraspora malaysiensis TaxID=161358 RepID=A0ABW6T350_9ACTN
MPITTVQELLAAARNAFDGRGVDLRAVDDALWDADLQIIPTARDDRYWRLVVDAVDEPRVIDSEDLPRELALILIAQPTATVIVRLADEDEAHAYALLGESGLRDLDRARAAAAAAMGAEVADALDIALGGQPR